MKKGTIYFSFILLSMSAFGQNKQYDPPWNQPIEGGINFTVKGVDNVPDIYGDINNPQLVIFMGGNQFMVLDDLLPAFKKRFPQYQHILVETLPPGLLSEQIKTGSLTIGNMRISVKPDIYTAGMDKIKQNKNMFERTAAYSATRLALMVQKGNPENISSLEDLKRETIRISMPNKKFEGIGKNVEELFMKVGGRELHDKIMIEKVKDSTTFLTQIHHRQSPMRILYNQSDVAPVWETEISYQQGLNHPVEKVAIPEKFNQLSVTMAGILKNAPHKEAARHFIDFLKSTEAQAIFKQFGFEQAPVEN